MADCCGGRRGRMLLSGGESGSEGKAVVAFGRSHSAENEQEEFTAVRWSRPLGEDHTVNMEYIGHIQGPSEGMIVRPSYRSAIHAKTFFLLHLLLHLSETLSLMGILAKKRHLVLHKHKWNDLWQSVTNKKGISSSDSTKITQTTASQILTL